jgi:hypothetical protein
MVPTSTRANPTRTTLRRLMSWSLGTRQGTRIGLATEPSRGATNGRVVIGVAGRSSA